MSVYFTTVIKRGTIQTINYKMANSVDSSGLKTLRHYESQSCFKSTSAVIQNEMLNRGVYKEMLVKMNGCYRMYFPNAHFVLYYAYQINLILP